MNKKKLALQKIGNLTTINHLPEINESNKQHQVNAVGDQKIE